MTPEEITKGARRLVLAGITDRLGTASTPEVAAEVRGIRDTLIAYWATPAVPLDAEAIVDGIHRGMAEQVRRDLLAEFVPVADDIQRPTPSPQETADAFTAAHPIGTPVLFWPGERRGPGRRSAIRTPAWVLGHGAVVVSVDGYSGGINLTHVQVTEEGADRG
jgi:hypothetical protein